MNSRDAPDGGIQKAGPSALMASSSEAKHAPFLIKKLSSSVCRRNNKAKTSSTAGSRQAFVFERRIKTA